jgi:hypothetical protein
MRIPATILARAAHGPMLLKVRHGRAPHAMRHERMAAERHSDAFCVSAGGVATSC